MENSFSKLRLYEDWLLLHAQLFALVFVAKDSCIQKNFKFRITRQFLKSELLHKLSGFITTDSRLKMLIIVVQMYGVEQLMWLIQFVPNLPDKYQVPSSVANNF